MPIIMHEQGKKLYLSKLSAKQTRRVTMKCRPMGPSWGLLFTILLVLCVLMCAITWIIPPFANFRDNRIERFENWVTERRLRRQSQKRDKLVNTGQLIAVPTELIGYIQSQFAICDLAFDGSTDLSDDLALVWSLIEPYEDLLVAEKHLSEGVSEAAEAIKFIKQRLQVDIGHLVEKKRQQVELPAAEKRQMQTLVARQNQEAAVDATAVIEGLRKAYGG